MLQKAIDWVKVYWFPLTVGTVGILLDIFFPIIP
jgi:hypothetical protein